MNSVTAQPIEWTPVCHRDDLVADSGVAVLFKGSPVAIFWLPNQHPHYFALMHTDPFSNADVLAYGIVCESHGCWSVASPLYKQHFRLDNGECVEDSSIRVKCWPVRLQGEQIELGDLQAAGNHFKL